MASTTFGDRKNKRPLDNESTLTSKRQTLSSSSENPFVLKCLVLGDYVGSVIGKHGKVIKDIQAQSGATVRLSQSNEFFPGTDERIAVFLSQNASSLLIAFSLVLARQYQALSEKTGTEQSGDADVLQVKLLIPKMAAGPLIGKRGAVIKRIIEASGARVHLAGVEEMDPYPEVEERAVTITGDMMEQLECVRLIFERMQERPESKTYANTSTNYTSGHRAQGPHSLLPFGHYPPRPAPIQGHVRRMDRSLPLPLPLPLRSLPGSSRFVAPPMAAPMMAAPMMRARHFPAPMQRALLPLQPAVMTPRTNGGSQRDPRETRGLADHRRSLRVGAPGHVGRMTTLSVAIPDSMVGALLGHQGQSIAAMQQYSTATIRIAKHPQLLDGESRRMVTIMGAAQACQTAKMLIEHKLSTVRLQDNWE